MATLKRYIQTETTSYAQECEAILYTGDNIAEICAAFPGMTVTSIGDVSVYKNCIRVGKYDVLVRPGDHIAKLVRLWDNDVWYRSPLTGDFDKYYKELEADDSPKLKRYIQTEFENLQDLCEAILYTGENIEQIRKVFPSVVIEQDVDCLDVVHHYAFVRPGEYLVKRWNKDTGKVRFHSPYSRDFDKYYKEIAKLTPNEITGKSAEMIIIDDAIGLHDKITAFARKHDIDVELCKRVSEKDATKLKGDQNERLERLCEIFRGFDLPIDTETFIKYTFLRDQWVKKHGDATMPIAEWYSESKLNLLKDMTFIEDSTRRSYFKTCVLIEEDVISYIPDEVVNHWCRDNGVYQTDYGVIKFKGEI